MSTVHTDTVRDEYAGPWTTIVFLQDDEYEDMIDAANDMGGSVDACIEYMAQWDYGTENDDARTDDAPQWGSSDTLHTGTYGGIEYVYAVNHHYGYASLNRRPVGH